MEQEQIEKLLRFFKRNNIILVNSGSIGDVSLQDCTVNEAWLLDELSDLYILAEKEGDR